MLPARHPPVPRGRQSRSRQPAIVGRRRDRGPPRGTQSRSTTPWPEATRPSTRNRSRSSASVTTRPSPSASRTTGTGTGTTATTPATPSAAGCATTKTKSGCSPRTWPWTGRTTAPSRQSRPPSGTRPSPATGTNHDLVIYASMPTPQLCPRPAGLAARDATVVAHEYDRCPMPAAARRQAGLITRAVRIHDKGDAGTPARTGSR
jgi:hypothetical protein